MLLIFRLGHLPAVPDRAVITLPPAKFECDDLRRLLLPEHFGYNGCALQRVGPNRDAGAFPHEKHFGESRFRASFHVEFFNFDNVAFRDPVLFAACLMIAYAIMSLSGKVGDSLTASTV